MHFSSKQEPGLNLYLSKYQDLSSGCRLHIACVIACLHKREMEKQFPISQRSCFSLCPPSLILSAPAKGKSGNRSSQEAKPPWSPEIRETKQNPWCFINNMQSLWTLIHSEWLFNCIQKGSAYPDMSSSSRDYAFASTVSRWKSSTLQWGLWRQREDVHQTCLGLPANPSSNLVGKSATLCFPLVQL